MSYRDLGVYRKAYDLALSVHRRTLEFPAMEQYELARQLRRSSKSIPANIAEGIGKRGSAVETQRFLKMAMGSCDETHVWLEFAKDLGYLDEGEFRAFSATYDEVGRMLHGLINRQGDRTNS
jgi:four helix bundle protein